MNKKPVNTTASEQLDEVRKLLKEIDDKKKKKK